MQKTYFTILDLGFSSIMTGLQTFGDSGFSWNGISGAQTLDWAADFPSKVGDCSSFNKLGLMSIPCEAPTNFMCESRHQESTTGT
jgi:hypothetical protein